jgi:hypothetical protein
MFVRWNFTVCWVIQSSFAISSFESPRASGRDYRLPTGGGTFSCAQIFAREAEVNFTVAWHDGSGAIWPAPARMVRALVDLPAVVSA